MISHAERMAKMGTADVATFGQPGRLVVGGVEYPITIAISRDMEPVQLGGRGTDAPRWVGRVLPGTLDAAGASRGDMIKTADRDYEIVGINPIDNSELQTVKLAKAV